MISSIDDDELIQLAKHKGIKTINIVRRSNVTEELLALGADVVIDSTSEDVVARVKDITGGKLAYAAIDAVGGKLTKIITGSTRDGGMVLEYANLAGTMDVVVGLEDLRRNVQVKFWNITNNARDCSIPERRQKFFTEVIKLRVVKVMTLPPPSKSFTLSQFKKALKDSQTAIGGAKTILVS